MRQASLWAIGLALVFCINLTARAQVAAQATTAASPGSENLEHVPRVPGVSSLVRGFNAGISVSGVHSSFRGWYESVTPAVSYTFSDRYSADVSVPLYFNRHAEELSLVPQPIGQTVLELSGAGDTLFGFHAAFDWHGFRDTASVSLSAPTGDRAKGLGAGQVTFDFDNHVERYIRQTGFLLDVGVGNSSGVVNNLLNLNYNSVGTLAHFQTGAIVWIYQRYYIQPVAYEQLPLGSQTVYLPGIPPIGGGLSPGHPNLSIVTGTGASEDNGFTTSAGIRITRNLTLSGYYNRSLRHHLDTVSAGVTYVLHGNPIGKKLSLIDRALREAARESEK